MTTHNDIWQRALTDLAGQMTKATFAQFNGTQLIALAGGVATVEVASRQAMEWLAKRLNGKVEAALASVLGQAVTVEYVVREATRPQAFLPPDEPEDEPAQPDLEALGAYHDKRNATIQPDKVMVFSQYLRKKWWPLLGPTASLLIMEMRQRCHKKSGRNSFKATYKSLAMAIGVSRETVKRLLARDSYGNFKHKYMGYFVKDMHVLKDSDGRGNIFNLGTQFVIFLDDPLTPEDE